MYTNIQSCIIVMMTKIKNNIIITGTLYIFVLAFLIFSIFLVFIRNINNNSKQLIKIKKVFKVCNINE